MSRLARCTAAAVGAVVALTSPRSGNAQEAARFAGEPSLGFEIRSVFGETTIDPGGDEIYVRIENRGPAPREGTVDVGPNGWGSEWRDFATATYSVPAGSNATIHLPVMSQQQVLVVAHDEKGAIVAQAPLAINSLSTVHVVDLEEVSRIGSAIGPSPIDPDYRAQTGYGSSSSFLSLQVTTSGVDRTTGDPVLPEYASGWRGVHAAIVKSDTLAELGGAELSALETFVLGGGTLAVVVRHPEDLAQPTLTSLLGGQPRKTPPSAIAFAPINVAAPIGIKPRWPANLTNPADSTEVSSYAGGNLEPSALGASATYGLGEVVLLGFDPTTADAAMDPWVQVRIAELARRAYERQASIVFGPASAPVRNYSFGYDDALREVRRELDPNQSSRFAIGVSTGLLCIYAVIAGPFAFCCVHRAIRAA